MAESRPQLRQVAEVVDTSDLKGRKFPWAKGAAVVIVERKRDLGGKEHVRIHGRAGWWQAHRFEVRRG